MKKLNFMQRLSQRLDCFNFKTLDPSTLPRGLLAQYNNPYFYTPMIQLKTPSEDFAATMRLLHRKRKIYDQDMKYMMDAIVSEYVSLYNQERGQWINQKKGVDEGNKEGVETKQIDRKSNTQLKYPIPPENKPDAGYHKNYQCESKIYGGVVDYLIFCNKLRNIVPILYFPTSFHSPGTIAACLWSLEHKPNNSFGYAIQTNGHLWQLIRISNEMKLQKTCMYEPNSHFKKLYSDEYHQQLVLGLIEEGLDLQKIEVRALRKVYDYIDQKRSSQELKEGEVEKPSLISKLLRK